MRLSEQQVQSITLIFQKVFSKGELVLFGSRVDDKKKAEILTCSLSLA